MNEFQSNTPQEVEDAVNQSKDGADPFVCICFYHPSIPPSLFTGQLFAKFRKNYSSGTVGVIMILDASKYSEMASLYKIGPTPSVVIVWKGTPLLIRRPGWDDTGKIIGCLKEDEWLSILRHMAQIDASEEKQYLSVDFYD